MDLEKIKELNLTDQEINLILTRRELQKYRASQPTPVPQKVPVSNSQASQGGLTRPAGFGGKCATNPKNEQEANDKREALKNDPKFFDKARPQGWDVHCFPVTIAGY